VLASKEDGGGMLRDIYLGLLANSAPVFGRIYRGMAAGDGLPALFHCHGGKDRTGMVAAVLLRLLGVSRRDVLDDYELTSTYRVRSMQDDSYENLVARGLNPAAAAGVLGTPRWAMEQALDVLEGEHGGAESFLLGPAGLSAVEVASLRARLVRPG
jgi:protein-tyrosine phosphatase